MQFYQKKVFSLIAKIFLFLCFFVFPYQKLFSDLPMKESVYCKYADQIVDEYIAYMKKNYQLYCEGRGGGFLHNVNNIDVSFVGTKNLSIEDTRILIVKSVEELLKRINENTNIQPYLSHYPFTERGLSLIVSLCKKNGERVDSDFIALAFVAGAKVYYSFYDHKEHCLKNLYEESYQEALKIVTQTKPLEKQVQYEESVSVNQKASILKALCSYIKNYF